MSRRMAGIGWVMLMLWMGIAWGQSSTNTMAWPPDLARVLAEADKLAALAQSKETDLSGLPAWPKVQALSNKIKRIRALQASGDISRAYDLAMSHRFAWEQSEIAAEVLDAMPFLVLGPFGDPQDTDITAPNKPLVPQFKGHDEPYIGENTTNGYTHQLPKDFHVDLTRKHKVYPGKEIGWQKTGKGRYLSFDEAGCGSPYPYWMVAYAYTEIYSPITRDGAFYWGSDHGCIRAYMNGSCFAGGPGPAGAEREARPDQGFMTIRLNQGWNKVLFKFVQRQGSRIYLRLVTFGDAGTKRDVFPLRDVRYRVPEEQ